MPKKYDAALRDRVVGAVGRGMSARSAAARYEVGVATAIRWVRRWREEGTHADPPRRQRTFKLDAYGEWLAALREAEPELSCQAVVDRLAEKHGERFHETTLWYWLRHNGITHKKRH